MLAYIAAHQLETHRFTMTGVCRGGCLGGEAVLYLLSSKGKGFYFFGGTLIGVRKDGVSGGVGRLWREKEGGSRPLEWATRRLGGTVRRNPVGWATRTFPRRAFFSCTLASAGGRCFVVLSTRVLSPIPELELEVCSFFNGGLNSSFQSSFGHPLLLVPFL